MTDTEHFNDIYLNLSFRKSQGKTDDFGNYIFEVEASNENLDLQNQIVLQNALLESKDEFLKGGVISYDHLHKRKDQNGNVISDPSMVIGEPIDVKTDGKSTIVVGKLYATNDKAKELIKMLKAGSTRVRASVGGIFPEIVKNVKTGVEKITHVLWNDLALTTSPVNNTVGSACFAKSMDSEEFVKALCAGYVTDSAAKTGGSALIKEDLEKNVTTVNQNNEDEEKEIIHSLISALQNGEVEGKEQAESYLTSRGIDKEHSRIIVREIIDQGGQMMKKSFSESVANLLKSLTGESQKDDDENVKSENEGKEPFVIEDDDVTINLDDEGSEGTEEGNEDGEEKTEKSNCKKSEGKPEDDDEVVDGTELIKSLNDELIAVRKSLKEVTNTQEDIGKAVVMLAQMFDAVAGEKMPARSVLNKSFTGKEKAAAAPSGRPTTEDFEAVQKCLIRCVREGKISAYESSMISSDVQKSMRTGSPVKPDYYKFLSKQKEMGGND